MVYKVSAKGHQYDGYVTHILYTGKKCKWLHWEWKRMYVCVITHDSGFVERGGAQKAGGLGAALRPPVGPGQKPWWGHGGNPLPLPQGASKFWWVFKHFLSYSS